MVHQGCKSGRMVPKVFEQELQQADQSLGALELEATVVRLNLLDGRRGLHQTADEGSSFVTHSLLFVLEEMNCSLDQPEEGVRRKEIQMSFGVSGQEERRR